MEDAKSLDRTEAYKEILNQLRQREAELKLVNSVQEAIGSGKEMKDVYELVGERIRELFDAQVTIIVTIDQQKGEEYFEYAYEDGERLSLPGRKYDEVRKKIIREKNLLHISENAAEVLSKINGKTFKPVPGTRMAKSALYVPMVVGEEVIGYVSIQNNDRENAFNEADVQLLSTLANSMSVALENARLFNETEQRNAELAVINSVQQGLAAQMDIQGIYDLVGDKIRDLFDSQVTGIYSFDIEKGMENFHYLFEDGERLYPDPRPLNQIRKWIIENKSLLLVNEDANNKIVAITGEKHTAVPGTRLPKSMLFVPLIIGNEVKGCVSLQNLDKENAFSGSDVQLLGTIANSMSVALENARLFNETEQRNAELAVINSVQQGLVAEMDMQGIYDLVGDKIRKLFDAQVTGIYSFNKEKGIESFEYLFEDGKRIYPKPRPYDKFKQRLIKTQNTINIQENIKEAVTTITGEVPKAVPGTQLPKSVVFVPLKVGDDVRGCVSLQNLDKEHAFSDADVQLLSTLVNSMSVALENARLFNETEQRNAELAVINSVQEGLVAEMDMQGIYDLVGERVRQLFDAEVIAIVTLNLDEEKEYFQYAFEEGERIYPSGRLYDNIRRKIINEKSPLLISENAAEIMSEIKGEKVKPVPGTRLAKSALYVPMIVGDKVQGYVTLQNNDRENAFDDADVRLLTTLANSMSVALENARLFSETEQRNAELAVINSVQQGLVAEMDMQGIYDLVGDKIRKLFDSQVTVIATFNYDNKTEEFHYVFEDGKRFKDIQPRKYDLLRQKIIDTQNLICINENAEEVWRRITGKAPDSAPGTRTSKSMLYVPMIVGKEVRGYVSLQNLDRENAFPESDVRLLSTLANSMTVALENARLFNETEQRNAELAVINSVQEGLVAEMDMQGIYDLVGDKIRDLFDAQVAAVATFNYNNNTEEFHYIFEDGKRFVGTIRPLDKIRQCLIDSQQLLYINENADEEWTKITGEKIVAVPGTKNAKSLLFVPMTVGKEVRGYVSLQNLDKENAFSDSDVRLLNTLVNSMSVALENARLFNETEQRNAELAVINSVQEGLVAEMDMQGIYDLVGNRLRDLFDAQAVVIATLIPERKEEIFNFIYENGERHYPKPRPYNDLRQKLIDTKELICINKEAGKAANLVPGTKEPKSMIFVPLIIGDVVNGYISLQNIDRENAFDDADIRLLSTLANSMTVTLENARLFNETTRLLAETEQRATEMQTVNNISRALVSQLEFDALMNLVGEQMRETFRADIVYLALHDKETNMLSFPYYYGDNPKPRPFGNGITEKIINSKEPLLINQNMDEAYEKIKAEKKGRMVESYLGVPIVYGKKAIGVISVQSTEQENRFNENDLRLLTTIAANVGVAMQNAEAYEKLQAALADLKSAQTQLVQQEKLASLGQLAAGIAHEIKNPLNFVNNFSELNVELIDEAFEELQKSPSDKNISEAVEILNDVKSNLVKILQHGNRADSIVKSMLQHSRGGSGKIERVEFNELIREYVNLAFHGMRAGKKVINVSIDLQLDENIGKVPLISEDFSRVILNLCNNAFDAMFEKLHAKQKTSEYSPKLTIRSYEKNRKVYLEIEDNGPGIPEDLKDKIFQPFFTTKKGTDGTGLGLSITNDIIEAHGGSLAIDSRDSATIFKIEIPS
ncbi:hypothetical protein C7S20_09015 [Christiangramia fulva]|uniref:histidine kinase n=1 Tax=Christiangramia fulva TaxID=2126553 RepID=A0A2R3Z556_9FLAO|nr:GAF domain-containing protein [Christiangramia fulva]AVR45400.1 hypothetical protein C7S20_09015 [Christiangramia fulva]